MRVGGVSIAPGASVFSGVGSSITISTDVASGSDTSGGAAGHVATKINAAAWKASEATTAEAQNQRRLTPSGAGRAVALPGRMAPMSKPPGGDSTNARDGRSKRPSPPPPMTNA